MATKHGHAEMTDFEEMIEEYVRYATSVKAAVVKRSEKREGYLHALQDVEIARAAYTKLVAVPGKENEALTKKANLDTAEQASIAAKDELDRVSGNVLEQFNIFKTQKTAELYGIVLHFVKMQVCSRGQGLGGELGGLSLSTTILVQLPTAIKSNFQSPFSYSFDCPPFPFGTSSPCLQYTC